MQRKDMFDQEKTPNKTLIDNTTYAQKNPKLKQMISNLSFLPLTFFYKINYSDG